MGRAPGPLPGGTAFPGPGAEQRLEQIGKMASESRSRHAPAPGLRATARLYECGPTGGRWEAREAQSQGRAGRARRGSRRDRSDRRRRAWLGVLNADRASGGDTSLCLGASSRRQGRSRMVAADLCPKSHGLLTRVGQARVQRAGRGLKTQRKPRNNGIPTLDVRVGASFSS